MEYLISEQPIHRRLEPYQTWRYIRADVWSEPSSHVTKALLKQVLWVVPSFAVRLEALHFVLPEHLLSISHPPMVAMELTDDKV